MKIFELSHITLNLKVNSKEELFGYISKKLYELNKITDEADFKKALFKREKEITTGMGEGVAIPHTKDISVIFPTLLYIRLEDAIEYESLDQKPVKEVFVIAMPNSYLKEHLVLLSKIADMLLKEKETLINLKTEDEIFTLINKYSK